MADQRKRFMNLVMANMHGRGLIVREINMTSFRKSLPAKAELLQRHLTSGSPGLKSVARMVVEFKRLRQQGVLTGLCSTATPGSRARGLSREFVDVALARGDDGEGFRDDTAVVIAYSLVRNGETWEWAPVGLASYGEADLQTTENETLTYADSGLQTAVQGGRIVEIDLLCAKGADATPMPSGKRRAATGGAPPGTGSLLLAYCLARAAQRKKNRQYRYHGAVLMTAADPATSAMGAVARRMGFQPVSVTVPRAPTSMSSGSTRTLTNYFRLYGGNANGWVDTALTKLVDLPPVCRHGTRCL